MQIYYQGFPGAYGHKASNIVAKDFKINQKDILGVSTFKEVFDKINEGNIGVLPIENSYAGSIHENFYHILAGKYKIIKEIYLDINHYLLANTKNISDIKEVYSHPQALMQTAKYCEEKGFKQNSFSDTAGAAKFVVESKRTDIASISSDLCSEIYGLNILQKNIQDQTGNTTRFLVVVNNDFDLPVETHSNVSLQNKQTTKISIIFKTKDTPSALYKCLGSFATRFINLTKIESLPARENRFEYVFWIDFEKNVDDNIVKDALEELKFFSKDLVVLGEY